MAIIINQKIYLLARRLMPLQRVPIQRRPTEVTLTHEATLTPRDCLAVFLAKDLPQP